MKRKKVTQVKIQKVIIRDKEHSKELNDLLKENERLMKEATKKDE